MTADAILNSPETELVIDTAHTHTLFSRVSYSGEFVIWKKSLLILVGSVKSVIAHRGCGKRLPSAFENVTCLPQHVINMKAWRWISTKVTFLKIL